MAFNQAYPGFTTSRSRSITSRPGYCYRPTIRPLFDAGAKIEITCVNRRLGAWSAVVCLADSYRGNGGGGGGYCFDHTGRGRYLCLQGKKDAPRNTKTLPAVSTPM